MPQMASKETMEFVNAQVGGPSGDERLLVRFYVTPMKNEVRSSLEGRPIFEDTEFIEIKIPGNRDHVIDRPVRDEDKERFPVHYSRFKARVSEQHVEGTLLSAWPLLTRAQVEEFKFFNVHTVEQLATIADSDLLKFPGGQGFKAKAKAYLAAAAGDAPVQRMQAALEEKDAKIAALEDAINEIRKQMGSKKG